MSIINIQGLGRHTTAALAEYGITTVEQFAKFTEIEINLLLGRSGIKFLHNAKALLKSA